MLVTVRQYAQVIKRNLGVSNEAKIGLGLAINDGGRTPVPAPTTEPLLTVGLGAPLQQTLRYADATTPDRRGKPAGVAGLLLAVSIGSTPPADQNETPARFVSRQPYTLNFSMADKGKTAYYYGRWMTAAGLVGPWSQLAQLMIAG